MQTPVGKHLMGGAAVGALGAIAGAGGGGEEVVDTETVNTLEPDVIRQSPDFDADTEAAGWGDTPPNVGGEPSALLNPAQGNYQPLGAGGEGTSYADTADVNSPEYQATMSQYADTQPALMQRTGEMGPGAEPSMGDQAPGEEVAETETETATATEEAPYGINPNTGEPYPAPKRTG